MIQTTTVASEVQIQHSRPSQVASSQKCRWGCKWRCKWRCESSRSLNAAVRVTEWEEELFQASQVPQEEFSIYFCISSMLLAGCRGNSPSHEDICFKTSVVLWKSKGARINMMNGKWSVFMWSSFLCASGCQGQFLCHRGQFAVSVWGCFVLRSFCSLVAESQPFWPLDWFCAPWALFWHKLEIIRQVLFLILNKLNCIARCLGGIIL